LKKEKKYNGKLERMELIRVTLAPIDNKRPFQLPSLFFIEFKIGSQVDLLRAKPRKWKGVDSTLQCKKDEEALKNLSSRFLP
jgi:hypothetical protein